MTEVGADRVPAQVYRLGRLALEPRRQLLDSGRPLPLGGKALDLLSALAEAGGGLVTKDELMAAVWPGLVVEENAIQVHISSVRKALGDEAERLVTVRGKGYRLVLDDDKPQPSEPPPASLAVLAFTNLTGDPNQDYLADGIAEELTTTLSRFSELKVAARTSAFGYRNRQTDVRSIARELGVTMIVEGSLRGHGERIRVTAQLIEAESGFHVWAQNFERRGDDLLALQDELASSIARVLQTQIRGSSRTDDPAAYALYLQARGLAGQVSPQSIDRAIALHRQALALDPSFARSWTGLGGTLMVGTATGLLPPDRRSEAREAIDRAIALDPGAASPVGIRAALNGAAGRWAEAAADFAAATDLDPAEPLIPASMALSLLAPAGQLRRAQALASHAVDLAPAMANVRLDAARLSLFAGDAERAREHIEMAGLLGANPTRASFALVQAELALQDGHIAQAITFFAQALDIPLDRETPLGGALEQVVSAIGGAGDRSLALRSLAVLRNAADEGGRPPVSPFVTGYLIRWFTRLGALDGAHEIAASFIADWRRTGHLTAATLHQVWRRDVNAFREHPAFRAFVRSLDLPAFWEGHGPPDAGLWDPASTTTSGSAA